MEESINPSPVPSNCTSPVCSDPAHDDLALDSEWSDEDRDCDGDGPHRVVRRRRRRRPLRTQHAATLKPSSKVHSSEAASSTSPTRERHRVRRAVSTDSTLAYRLSTLVISYYELPPAEEAKAPTSSPTRSTGKRPLSSRSLSSYQI